MEYNASKIYYIHISPATFADLPNETMDILFSDGRYSSPFIEQLIGQKFDNITYLPGNKSSDFTYNNGLEKPLEQRYFSTKCQSINLIPSNMIGAGRKYDEDKYKEKLTSISSFIIPYPVKSYQHLIILSLPAIEVYNIVPLKQKLNRQDITNILGEEPNTIIDYLSNKENISVIDNMLYEFDKPWKIS